MIIGGESDEGQFVCKLCVFRAFYSELANQKSKSVVSGPQRDADPSVKR